MQISVRNVSLYTIIGQIIDEWKSQDLQKLNRLQFHIKLELYSFLKIQTFSLKAETD